MRNIKRVFVFAGKLLEVHTEGKQHLLLVFVCCDWRTVTEILLAVCTALVFRQVAKIQNTDIQISGGGIFNDSFSFLLRKYNSSAFSTRKLHTSPVNSGTSAPD